MQQNVPISWSRQRASSINYSLINPATTGGKLTENSNRENPLSDGRHDQSADSNELKFLLYFTNRCWSATRYAPPWTSRPAGQSSWWTSMYPPLSIAFPRSSSWRRKELVVFHESRTRVPSKRCLGEWAQAKAGPILAFRCFHLPFLFQVCRCCWGPDVSLPSSETVPAKARISNQAVPEFAVNAVLLN